MRLGVLDIGSNTGHLLVVDAYRDNEAFYAAAEADVGAAWDQRAQAIAAREESAARLRALRDWRSRSTPD